MMSLSEEQAERYLSVVEHDRLSALYKLALTTGMRDGELLGVRWQDVNLEAGTLQVRVNVQETTGRYVLAETKAAYSRRNIALTPLVIEALRHNRTVQGEERLALGDAWDDPLDLVFPNALGGIMIPHNLAKRSFKRYLTQAGLPQTVRFHDLRHTAATLLHSHGVHPKVVSEMLGHADISITLRIYAHVTPHMQDAAVQVMENIFGRKSA